MAIINHILGFPRIGANRELKNAQEKYWEGKISKSQLLSVGLKLRIKHWEQQKKLGIQLIPVGDFAWYDHVLATSMLVGNVPKRHKNKNGTIDLDTLFYVARGVISDKSPVLASEMTKWFNTNYHYIVPEFIKGQNFGLSWFQLFDEIDEALDRGYNVKPVILGPMTYLWLGKVQGEKFNKLDLLNNLLLIYKKILLKIKNKGIDWVQIDEPILCYELPQEWLNAFCIAYNKIKGNVKLLLTTFFDSIEHNLHVIKKLPVQGIHVDLVDGNYNILDFNNKISKDWVLSLGIINGRNIWKTDLNKCFDIIKPIIKRKKLWIGSSCSLLHCPVDLECETDLDAEIKNWFAFSVQKCYELNLLTSSLNSNKKKMLNSWSNMLYTHNYSSKINNPFIKNKIQQISDNDIKRNQIYSIRARDQKIKFKFPYLPTTTIGSFPQTNKIRKLRSDYKNGIINFYNYNLKIKKYIKDVILQQELLELDVLVHGEFERNDMVEYFGENLNGFVFTKNGWVQSYGSRCVKPPIIIGDVYRSKPITLEWLKYAQSLTNKPVKAMLTGPVTILLWSFVREDIPLKLISNQIALALQEEVLDLEKIGINIIQIDEPALREGLPLKKSNWKKYLSWSVESFKLSCSKVKNTTQIHTHMCYCEFQDIMDAIVQLDVDVITIETARSNIDLLEFFKQFKYPNEIGPGVYDIHSPNIPSVLEIERLIKLAMQYIPVERLWINPDCGLKTRKWKEVKLALNNMVVATKNIRKKI